MKHGCTEFRRLLWRQLEGRPSPELKTLDWHAHLVGCEACRALLFAEEALEALLSTLPEPKLPPDLAQRVIARLRHAFRPDLDALLELDAGASPPANLAERVLAGLAEERARIAADERLDRLLGLEDAVNVPRGLEERVLAGLGARSTPRPARRALPWRPMRRLAAAAVIASVALAALWKLAPREGLEGRPDGPGEGSGYVAEGRGAPGGGALEVPDEELLAALDVLENWEVLASEDDLDLDVFHHFDAGDEVLLEFLSAAEEDGEEPDDEDSNG